MATILLLADEAHGARLKSDLEYIGHRVEHLIMRGQSSLPSVSANGIDLAIIDPESSLERLALWDDDHTPDAHTVKRDDLVINMARYEVRVKGSVVELTLKEYELLKHLVTHEARVFTRSDLLDSIWGYDYYGGMRTVDVHIRRLRSKLGESGNAIATVRGVGYKFDPP